MRALTMLLLFAMGWPPWGNGGAGAGAICGDHKTVSPEGCDDGNTADGDGCSSTCFTEPGFTCIGSPSVCTMTTGAVPPGGALMYYRAQDLVFAGRASFITSAVQDVSAPSSAALGLGQVQTWKNYGTTATADLSNATGNQQPQLFGNCIGSRACLKVNGPASQVELLQTGAFTSIAQPVTVCAVAAAIGGGSRALVSDGNNIVWASATNWGVNGGGTPGAGVTGSADALNQFDVVCAVMNGASSAVYVNGVKTSGNQFGVANLAQFVVGAKTTGGLNPWQGYVAEVGVWSGSNVPLPYYTYAKAFYGVSFPATPASVAPAAATKTVCMGDSITAGSLATYSYPQYLQSWAGTFGNSYFENHGTAGFTVANVKTEYEANVRGHGFQQAFLLVGINDIIAGTSGATTSTALDVLCTELCTDGLRVRIGTTTPWDSYVGWSAGKQTEQTALNTLIRTEPARCPCATVVDLNASMADPADANKLNTFFASSDGLHPNDPGYQHIASAFLRP